MIGHNLYGQTLMCFGDKMAKKRITILLTVLDVTNSTRNKHVKKTPALKPLKICRNNESYKKAYIIFIYEVPS